MENFYFFFPIRCFLSCRMFGQGFSPSFCVCVCVCVCETISLSLSHCSSLGSAHRADCSCIIAIEMLWEPPSLSYVATRMNRAWRNCRTFRHRLHCLSQMGNRCGVRCFIPTDTEQLSQQQFHEFVLTTMLLKGNS